MGETNNQNQLKQMYAEEEEKYHVLTYMYKPLIFFYLHFYSCRALCSAFCHQCS